MNPVTYTLTVPPAAHALLLAAAWAEGFTSVEDSLRDHLRHEARAFAEAVADSADPTLQQLFTFNQPNKEKL